MSAEVPQHLITAKQISPQMLANIFSVSDQIDLHGEALQGARKDLKTRYRDDVAGIAMTFESSSRTRLSFIRAASSLRIPMVNEPNPKESMSLQKGESLADTMMTLNAIGYNIIVFRSDQAGDAELAAQASEVPVINAGDGDGDHPTQAVTDAKTITEAFDLGEGITIAHIGDPWNSRTVHSQIDILRPFNPKHIFSAVGALSLDNSYRDWLKAEGIKFEEVADAREAVAAADVVDISRYQVARQKKSATETAEQFQVRKERIRTQYLKATMLGPKIMKIIESDPAKIILHPLPRNEEIPVEITDHPQGRWKEQMQNGMLTRRAILYLALTEQLFAKRVSIHGVAA